jgi:hypothetical protein
LIVANAQRQAAVRAAWSAARRAAGLTLWNTPRVLTFTQFAEHRLADQWSAAALPDRLLPSGAEWRCCGNCGTRAWQRRVACPAGLGQAAA